MDAYRLTQLVSRLPVKVLPTRRSFNNPDGLFGRLKILRKTVTALVRHERIEANYFKADEARPYMERLISEAIRYGDAHRPTMALADFWLEDKTLVPKLFKVLVPRYAEWPAGVPYTRMLRAPSEANADGFVSKTAVIELRGNPYPPLPGPFNTKANPALIHNVLLEEARKDYFNSQSKLAQQAETHTNLLPEAETAHLDDTVLEKISAPINKNEAESESQEKLT